MKYQRGVSFEELLRERVITTVDHPARSDQHLMLFEREGYVWVVPCVTEGNETFLKTLYPCRKYTRLYREGRLNEEKD